MNHALYGHNTPHSRIATYLLHLGFVDVNQGNLEEPLSTDQERLRMKRAIYAHDKAHPEIAASLSNLALV